MASKPQFTYERAQAISSFIAASWPRVFLDFFVPFCLSWARISPLLLALTRPLVWPSLVVPIYRENKKDHLEVAGHDWILTLWVSIGDFQCPPSHLSPFLQSRSAFFGPGPNRRGLSQRILTTKSAGLGSRLIYYPLLTWRLELVLMTS